MPDIEIPPNAQPPKPQRTEMLIDFVQTITGALPAPFGSLGNKLIDFLKKYKLLGYFWTFFKWAIVAPIFFAYAAAILMSLLPASDKGTKFGEASLGSLRAHVAATVREGFGTISPTKLADDVDLTNKLIDANYHFSMAQAWDEASKLNRPFSVIWQQPFEINVRNIMLRNCPPGVDEIKKQITLNVAGLKKDRTGGTKAPISIIGDLKWWDESKNDLLVNFADESKNSSLMLFDLEIALSSELQRYLNSQKDSEHPLIKTCKISADILVSTRKKALSNIEAAK
jgi:hypothetical protein